MNIDIIELARTIYSTKPQPACTQRVSLIGGHSVNEAFEIISLMILEGLDQKIVTNPQFDTCKDEKKFIQQMTVLLKLYLASLGIRLNIEMITKKDLKKVRLGKSANFWTIKEYKFDLNCLYNYVRKGKHTTLYYNPKSKIGSINDGIIIVKIRSHCLKITFKQY